MVSRLKLVLRSVLKVSLLETFWKIFLITALLFSDIEVGLGYIAEYSANEHGN